MTRARAALAAVVLVWGAGCGGGGGRDAGPDDAGTDLADPGPDAARCLSADDCGDLVAGPCGRVSCSSAGLCEVVADTVRDGQSCTPDDRCAVGQATCAAGICVPASRRSCPARACLEGACDPATGECGYASVADGQPCEAEGNPCTTDRCVGGACQAGENACPCTGDGDCPAPADRCLGDLRCESATGCLPDPARAVACEAPEGPCRTNACDPATGTCVAGTLADGTACGTATACLGAGSCLGGDCVQAPACADGNPCTEDRCDAGTGACTFPPDEGAPCDDGNACTQGDACLDGGCVPGSARDCDDGNECTLDACEPATGCVATPVVPGGGCDDGDPCTVDDACLPGGVCGGTAMACDDGNDCTTDACDSATALCRFQDRDGEACQDGNACTAGDRCATDQCVAGTWTPGCCVVDEDCDDGDACTSERCADGLCRADGEAAGTCDPGAGCGGAWCLAADGTCQDLDLRMPRRLLAWDLRAGGAAAGLAVRGAWAALRDGEGVRPGADLAEGLTLDLPARRGPAGVVVLSVDQGSTPCGRIQVDRAGVTLDPATCGAVDGRTRAAWTWVDDGSPWDVAVHLEPEASLAGLEVFAWASAECVPLGPVLVAEGKGYSDLAMSAGTEVVSVAAKKDLDVVAAGYSLARGILASRVATSEPLETQAGRFDVQILAGLDGLPTLLAYGGTDKQIVVASLDDDGTVLKRSVVSSQVLSIADYRFEPALARSPGGDALWLAWSLSREASPDLEIGLARGTVVDGTPTWDASGVLLNGEGAGVQRRPRLVTRSDGGTAAWISEPDLSTAEVVLRRIDGTGQPAGDDTVVSTATTPLVELALADVPGGVAWVAERDGGVLQGGVRRASDLAPVADLAFPAGSILRRYAPDLARVPGGAMVVVVGVDASGERVYRTFVGADGAMGAEVPVSASVDRRSASPSVTSWGPWWSAVAWHDDTDDRPSGLYLTLAAPACDAGTVRCDGPSPRVCTGLGADPYVALPAASGWCP